MQASVAKSETSPSFASCSLLFFRIVGSPRSTPAQPGEGTRQGANETVHADHERHAADQVDGDLPAADQIGQRRAEGDREDGAHLKLVVERHAQLD